MQPTAAYRPRRPFIPCLLNPAYRRGTHVPSSIAGFGRYTRRVTLKPAAAAANRFAALSLPGESFWMYHVERPVLVFI